jgi:multicomponent Na+:H+ antiporter subunit G
MAWIQMALGGASIALGILGILFGVYAVLRLKSFYARIVVTSKVEAMGFTAIVIGCMILAGWSLWSAKLAFILAFELLTVAVSSHAIARSAWKSGYHLHMNREVQEHD